MAKVKLVVAAVFLVAAIARGNFREFQQLPVDPSLEAALRHASEATLKTFTKLTADNLALSIIDVTKPDVMSRADYHGDAPFYPASVIKLFYMLEVFHQHKENDPDVPRALHEMIVVSDNDATGFLLDTISDTCSGPELQGRALRKFIERRGVVNRYVNPMGYDVSAMAKPWSFGPFGRDVQLMGGPARPNRNRATANAFASLLLWIERRRAVSPQASDAMMALLARPLDAPQTDEGQVISFIGEGLPAGTKLWSKAGWTTEVRHDAAYIELPAGRKLILVILTRGTADDKTLIPAITKTVLGELAPIAAPP
ncbi:MAG: class A beta-lactamase-related serine hydrolase [Acidobacteriota bacterium]|nr:class A beta-lactamase-related serine hydrolase [Acidobacteriota bacterium]